MSEVNYDIINRYLDGEMSAEERQAFEHQMKEDQVLSEEVDLLKEVNLTLKNSFYPDEGELALRNTMKGLEKDYFHEQTKVVQFRKYTWLAVAAAIILVAISVFIWSPWEENIYDQYAFVEMPAAERGNNTDSILKEASTYFNEKEFNRSLPLFESALNQDPQNAFARFYFGIALMHEGQTGKARQELETVYNGTSVFKQESAFYIALSFIKDKNEDKAKEWLNKISPDASNYQKAQDVLKKL